MRIGIVILNWNGKSFLQRFLPFVLKSAEGIADVVVADNGSSDESLKAMSEVAKDLNVKPLWVPLGKNWGFTGGYNRAFKALQKEALSKEWEYYVLLNSDVLAPCGWLEPLAEFMDFHPKVGVCQPKILSLSAHTQFSEEVFEYAGAAGGFIDRYGFPFCRGRVLSHIEKDCRQYDTPCRTFWATGACMVVRKSVWEKLGGLDEVFFAHMEEIDFCWRAQLSGCEVWCIPQSKVYHLGGGTLPNNSPRKLFFNYRNNLLMLWKNLPPKHKRLRILQRKLIDLLSAICYLLTGKFSFVKSVLLAHKDFDRKRRLVKITKRLNTNVFGIYPHSIILRFFLGKKTFTDYK